MAGAGKANGQAVSVTAPSTQASEARDRLTALRQTCLDVALEGRGNVTFLEAEELGRRIGVEAATTLIRQHGGRVFMEVLSAKYWASQRALRANTERL